MIQTTATGLVPASDLRPGQTVAIHGGVRVTLLSVTPYEVTDSFVPSSPWKVPRPGLVNEHSR